jgi:hypothetical protein
MKQCFLWRLDRSALITSILWALAFVCVTLSSAQAADEQVIYGIKPDGDLLYFKYLGLSDGSFSWGKTNAKIGSGWNFRQVFSGGDGVIFAITEAGDLLYFKYLGLSDGSFSWGKTNAKIGSGWSFAHAFAELRSPVQLEPPRQETLPPPENERCANYARNAVDDYATMRRFRECLIRDSPRWQPNYRNHYQWCLTARPEWLASEAKARDAHLVRCGVRHSY